MPGQEVARAESETMVSVLSSTDQRVPGLAVTFVSDGSPLLATLCADLAHQDPASGVVASIALDGVPIARATVPPDGVSEKWESKVRTARLDDLIPGRTYTVSVLLRAASGWARIAGDWQNPASLAVSTR